MATGQNAFQVTLYGEVAYEDNLNGGFNLYGNGYSGPKYRSLPVQGTNVLGIPYTVYQTAWGTVYAQSIIEVYPMGLQIPAKPKRYISDSTEAALHALRT